MWETLRHDLLLFLQGLCLNISFVQKQTWRRWTQAPCWLRRWSALRRRKYFGGWFIFLWENKHGVVLLRWAALGEARWQQTQRPEQKHHESFSLLRGWEEENECSLTGAQQWITPLELLYWMLIVHVNPQRCSTHGRANGFMLRGVIRIPER